jgi:hypothetical protein
MGEGRGNVPQPSLSPAHLISPLSRTRGRGEPYYLCHPRRRSLPLQRQSLTSPRLRGDKLVEEGWAHTSPLPRVRERGRG